MEFEFIFDIIKKYRRDLHSIPELSFKEFKTSKYIESILKESNVKYKKILNTGIVAYIKGDTDHLIGFRADMDALPIKEELNYSFSSTNENMHACGHDFHMAILLGLIKYYSSIKTPPVSLLFIFQPGEEGAGGALKMIKNGVFEIFGKPNFILGYHIDPELSTGLIAAKGGDAWAGSVELEVILKGNGGHGAYPEKTFDPVNCFVNIYNMINSFVAKRKGVSEKFVITCGKISGAEKSNIIPSELISGFSFRYFDDNLKETFLDFLSGVVKNFAEILNGKGELKIISDYIPLKNSIDILEKIKNMYKKFYYNKTKFKKYFPELIEQKLLMLADDMAYFIKETKGIYFSLGVMNKKPMKLHTPSLDPDENALNYGFSFFRFIIENYKF